MELRDGWRAAPADDHLRRAYPVPEFNDQGWEPIRVPAHWRSTPAFASLDGPLLHRIHFDAPRPAEGRRSWLVFDGVFYQADVWLDGSYVGDPEGYFFPHAYEVTSDLGERDEHLLAVELTCSRPLDRTAKRNLTGLFQHGDSLDPAWNPGGLWRPVHIEETGPVRISRMRVLCPEASEERAVLAVRVLLDAAEATTVRIRTAIAGVVEHHQVQPVAAGENRLEWEVFVEQPSLWWPHALGSQPLHDVEVDVRCGDELSDRSTVITGLRQVRLERWILSVNSERMFLKGASQGPARMDLAEATPADLDADVALARNAGLDLLRVKGHISRPELYEAADRQGMLVWQDLPLQWGYVRGVRKQAARQAREAVDLLGHHPSIAVWCGHNDPFRIDIPPGESATILSREFRRRYATQQMLPSWNKTILDRSIRRALDHSDHSRPAVPHSGVLPGPFSGGTDSHLSFGWHHGAERD
ncbi:MAG TPA: hypothetical protein VMY34_06215, partial [Acidimicrobiales bacterium]|nr:hypothetical protein [Acidimicrobiales bacterium]